VYNVWHLLTVARSGLDDMAPALRRAFNRDRADDRLDEVFGPRPRLAIAVLTVGGIALGQAIERLSGFWVFTDYVNASAVIIGALFALRIRGYLFGGDRAREEDFPWLAASIIPAAIALVLVAFVSRVFGGGIEFLNDAPFWTRIGGVLVAAVDSMGVAAALTIAVAALCYCRNWGKALRDLAAQLFLFKLAVFLMVLLIIEIGIVGPILAALLDAFLGIRFPAWLSEFVDQLSYAGLMFTIYFAVIGSVWMVCRRSFGQLLVTGDAEILATIKQMAESPKQHGKRVAKEKKKALKEEKRRAKAEKKREKRNAGDA
jgi:hypothetical protein